MNYPGGCVCSRFFNAINMIGKAAAIMMSGDHAKEADNGAAVENAGISSGITHSAAKVNAAEIAP